MGKREAFLLALAPALNDNVSARLAQRRRDEVLAAADAYNALTDLRSLEILINVFALFPDEITQLCTGDKNLALFRAGIRAFGFQRTDTGAIYEIDPMEGIMPAKWRDA